MDLGRSINYVFQDPKWMQKLLIGSVIFLATLGVALIPFVGWVGSIVINLFIYGYAVRILLQVAEGRDLPLPEWDDFGGDFTRGLKVFVAAFV